ncbi:hypothetical protein CHLRE_12g485438v5 [Chlamydomonas reinhardtii]|uniref:ATP-dependent DNA helicase n=1 Tax=Chlamydomonas reinhardtii TaxID=3055 RepID=A0A2K3D1R3_CHLRE|nr:uncharacterized protein CHLRE_12g485438v5 [Chlamydomonas reinhardtii]PNW74473.1 hypothetical protein CHLRE_12g485438v5 [Chlamydomonas reinhardtii]
MSLRWLNAKAVLIEEGGMISGDAFDKAEAVARIVRGREEYFGGLQVIFVGDFCQLPPISDIVRVEHGDDEYAETEVTYAFQARRWNAASWEYVTLLKCWRQLHAAPAGGEGMGEINGAVAVDDDAEDLLLPLLCIVRTCTGDTLPDAVREALSLARHVTWTKEENDSATNLLPKKHQVRSFNLEKTPREGRERFAAVDRYKGKTYVWTRDPAAGQEFVHPELLQGAGAPVATKRFRCGAASARDDQAGDRNQVKAVFHRITADPYLTLAVGSEVIATANFGDVANGTRGVVKAFLQLDDGEQMHYDEIKLLHDGSRGGRPRGVQADDIRHLYPQVHAQRMWPEVEWTDSNGKKSVSVVMPMWFSVNDYHCGSEICARLQLPLLPSYALTVHKAQGLTLRRVTLDVSNIFDFGQLYVALSRVRRFADLRIVGNIPAKLKLARASVVQFEEATRWRVLDNSAGA